MNEDGDILKPRKSFFIVAAWISLFTPLVIGAIAFPICLNTQNSVSSNDFTRLVVGCGFFAQIGSLLLGLVSFFGIPRHGARAIVWPATIGVLASAAVALFLFVLALGTSMGGNC